MSVQYQPMPRTESASRLAQFFLGRLDRLTGLTPELGARFNAEQLLRHAIYSTYLDCREYGAAEPAQEILDRARNGEPDAPGRID